MTNLQKRMLKTKQKQKRLGVNTHHCIFHSWIRYIKLLPVQIFNPILQAVTKKLKLELHIKYMLNRRAKDHIAYFLYSNLDNAYFTTTVSRLIRGYQILNLVTMILTFHSLDLKTRRNRILIEAASATPGSQVMNQQS